MGKGVAERKPHVIIPINKNLSSHSAFRRADLVRKADRFVAKTRRYQSGAGSVDRMEFIRRERLEAVPISLSPKALAGCGMRRKTEYGTLRYEIQRSAPIIEGFGIIYPLLCYHVISIRGATAN